MQPGIKAPDLNWIYYALSGRLENVTRVVIGGFNPDIDIATAPEDIWPVGGLMSYYAAAETLEILSASASDTLAGVGARTVVLGVIRGDFTQASIVVNLDGITPVSLGADILRINSGVVLAAGTSRSNVGALTIRVAGGGAVRGQIPAGYSVLQQVTYCVPVGMQLQVLTMVIGQGMGGAQEGIIWAPVVRNIVSGVERMPFSLPLDIRSANPYKHTLGHEGPIVVIPAKSEFSMRVLSVGASNTPVHAALLGLLMPEAAWNTIHAQRVIVS